MIIKTEFWLIKILPLMLAVLLVGLLPTTVFSDAPDAHLFFEPGALTARTCEEYTLAVHVADVVDLTGYDLLIRFDHTAVEILAVVNGSFLDTPEENGFYAPSNDLGNTTGELRFGMVQQGVALDPDVEPQSGEGELVRITLKGLVPNETSAFVIDEESVLVSWPDVEEIDFFTTAGSVETVNCPPTAQDQTVTTLMDTPVDITLQGHDPDGRPLQYTIVTPPVSGVLSGALPNITYTPDAGFFGTDTFTFTVFDGYDTSDVATVTVLVGQVKFAPLDVLLSANTILEGQPIETLIGGFTTVTEDPHASYDYTLVPGVGADDNASFILKDDQLLSAQVFAYQVQDTYSIRVRSTDQEDPTQFVEKVFSIEVLEAPKIGFDYFFAIFFR